MTPFRLLVLAFLLAAPGVAAPAEGPPAPGEPTPVEPPTGRWGLWEARVGLAAVDDSNPSLLSEELALNVPDSRRTVSGADSDRAADVRLRLAAYPSETPRAEEPPHPPDWHTGMTLEGGHSAYGKLHFLDLSELKAAVHLARGRSPVGALAGPLGTTRVPPGATPSTLLVQAGVSQVLLDGAAYLRTLAAGASYGLRPADAFAAQLDLEVRDRRFAHEPAVGRLSGTEVRLQLAPTFFLAREDRYLRLSGQWGRRQAGRPFSGTVRRGGAELALPLATGWSLFLGGFLQQDDFDHRESDLFFTEFNPFDPDFDPQQRLAGARLRRDRTTRAAATLVWTVRPAVQVVARWSATRRDSNLGTFTARDALDYRRTVASLGFDWTF